MSAVTLEQWARALAAAAKGGTSEKAVRGAVRKVFRTMALDAERRAKTTATTDPRVRTGRLRASIASSVAQAGGVETTELRLRAGGDGAKGEVRYARALEEGATIRPRGRYLTIPLRPHALTPAGVARYTSAREVPDLFVLRLKGKLFLARRGTTRGGRGRLELWYLLHPGPIQIRARRFLAGALTDTVREAESAFASALQQVIESTADPGGTGGG